MKGPGGEKGTFLSSSTCPPPHRATRTFDNESRPLRFDGLGARCVGERVSWNAAAARERDIDRSLEYSMETPLALEIFWVACKAVLKVFFIAAVGCWARRKGLLDAKTAKTMSKLNGTVFLPCLLFVSLGRSVTIDQLRDVWLLPLTATWNIALGATFGAMLLRLLRVPDGFRGPAVAASAFGNSLALPVVLISSIIGEGGRVGRIVFTKEDQAAAMLYLGAYMTSLTILMWTVGPAMMVAEKEGKGGMMAEGEGHSVERELGSCDHDSEAAKGLKSPALVDSRHPSGVELTLAAVEGEVSVAMLRVSQATKKGDGNVQKADADGAPLVKKIDSREALLALSRDQIGAGETRVDTLQNESDNAYATQRSAPSQRVPLYQRVATAFAPAINPNTVASVLGIVVGIIPPVRAALFEEDGPLHVFADAANIVAAAAIPQVIVILGASLAKGPDHSLCDRRTALSIAMIRLAVLPMVNILIFLVLQATLPVAAVPTSPAFWLVFLGRATSQSSCATHRSFFISIFHDINCNLQVDGERHSSGRDPACCGRRHAHR